MPISRVSFLNVLVTVSVFSVVVGFFVIWSNVKAHERRVATIEKKYFDENKELVKHETKKLLDRIGFMKKTVYGILKSSLSDKTGYVLTLFDKEVAKNPHITKKELIKKFATEISAFKWHNGTGYIYILDSNGDVLHHENREYIGKNVATLAGQNREIADFLKNAISSNEFYGTYRWMKPGESSKLFDKYVYVKKFEPLDIYVSAGFYTDEVDRDIQKIILEQLKHERFGHNEYGYIWVHDLNSTLLGHPINKELVGKDVSSLITKDGKPLFKLMNELALKSGEGFISYEWYRPDGGGVDKKLSYIRLVKEWGWVVGSGFYMSELENMIKDEKAEAAESMQEAIVRMLFVLSILAIVTILAARIISKRISEVEKKQKLYSVQLEQYKNILDETAVVSKTDTNGCISYVNDRFCKISGYSKDEVIGVKHNIVSHPQTPKEVFRAMWNAIGSGETWRGIVKNRSKSGKSYYNDTTIIPIKDENGRIVEYMSAGVDLTELVENREKLVSSFQTDMLTGLGSRVKLLSHIKEEQKATLALIDISMFSEVNDLKGHAFGDKIIIECSKRLFESEVFGERLLFRVHADVFAVLSYIKNEKELEIAVKEFMSEDAKRAYVIDDEELLITYNAGIAEGCGEILAWCEIALQNAKNSKDSHAVVFASDENSIAKFKENLVWTSKINKALDNDGVEMYYQPIYNYHEEKIEKFECLMRIVDEGKVYTPYRFLDIAKKTKLYPRLTYRVIEKSTAAFAKNSFEFSINLTIDDLLNQGLIAFLLERAKLHGVLSRMVVEIVESEEMQNYEEILSVIKSLKSYGVKIAIDDFGSGYSNYEYLSSLQADYVKIDGSLVKAICKDEKVRSVVSSIVDFARKYDMKTIAEFVSDEMLDKEARALGVDYAQGYYYGEPQALLLQKPK